MLHCDPSGNVSQQVGTASYQGQIQEWNRIHEITSEVFASLAMYRKEEEVWVTVHDIQIKWNNWKIGTRNKCKPVTQPGFRLEYQFLSRPYELMSMWIQYYNASSDRMIWHIFNTLTPGQPRRSRLGGNAMAACESDSLFTMCVTLPWKRIGWHKWKWMNPEGRSQKDRFLTVGRASKAITWPAPDFKERTFNSSGFSAEGALVSASVVCPAAQISCRINHDFFLMQFFKSLDNRGENNHSWGWWWGWDGVGGMVEGSGQNLK